ncbi:MAG: type II and III secretion system protein [Candidatus Omnitrophica bacterium]|nr:type II and III secretion system protein [Candidatus Omnitrophota bacterium]
MAHRGAADAETALTSAQLGTLDASQAVAVLQALERDTDTKILARPKVLTLDNESAVIQLSTNQAIGFQSTTGEQTATTTATPERTTTGVVLTVTPQVNKDGFVTMLVEPSVTKVETAKVQPPTKVGGTVVDPKTRSARALVRIRQGETLVMGGLIDRSEQAVLKRVPGLSAIPVLGEAFKNREVDNSASELVVFVTPRIVAEPSEPEAVANASPAPRSLASSAVVRKPTDKERPASVTREREQTKSRQDVMDDALNRLEPSSL